MSLRVRLPALLLAIISSAAAHAAPLYKVTRLSEAASSAYVTDLNNAGQVIGAAGAGRYLWTAAGATRLDDNFSASAINRHGVVAGTLSDPSGWNYEAATYRNGVYTRLGTLTQEPPQSVATAINDNGVVVGWSRYEDMFSGQTVRFGANGPVSLHLPLDADSPTGINASGTIVGKYNYEDPFEAIFVQRTYLYQNGKLTSLPLLGNDDVIGSAINDANTVVGAITYYAGGWAPFLYANGVVTPLATPGGAYGWADDINNAGQVVGRFGDTSNLGHAFLFDGGASYDIDTLLAPGSGLTIKSASAINDLGQIGGEGCDTAGNCYAVLLSPVPEPTTWGMWLAGVGVIGCLARRRHAAALPS